MARVTYSARSRLAPDIVWAALTDFSPRRSDTFPDLSAGAFQLLESGPTSATVREGTNILGGIWVVEHYDWSEPMVVKATSGDSNVVHSGGEWRMEVVPATSGGSIVRAHMDRRSKGWRGRLLHGLFQLSGGRLLALRLRRMLAGLEARP